jgi:signal transduction histidine kinase
MSGLRSSVSQTVKEVQNIIYDLRPTLLDDLGLIPALHWYTESRLKEQGVEVELSIMGRPRRLPPEVETTLFRVTQEAVTNVLRHASAGQVWLDLKFDTDAASIRIRDDGQGFLVRYPTSNLNDRTGLGLLGIQERASLLGGRFEVHSTPGEGTDLSVWIPVSQRVVDDE